MRGSNKNDPLVGMTEDEIKTKMEDLQRKLNASGRTGPGLTSDEAWFLEEAIRRIVAPGEISRGIAEDNFAARQGVSFKNLSTDHPDYKKYMQATHAAPHSGFERVNKQPLEDSDTPEDKEPSDELEGGV